MWSTVQREDDSKDDPVVGGRQWKAMLQILNSTREERERRARLAAQGAGEEAEKAAEAIEEDPFGLIPATPRVFAEGLGGGSKAGKGGGEAAGDSRLSRMSSLVGKGGSPGGGGGAGLLARRRREKQTLLSKLDPLANKIGSARLVDDTGRVKGMDILEGGSSTSEGDEAVEVNRLRPYSLPVVPASKFGAAAPPDTRKTFTRRLLPLRTVVEGHSGASSKAFLTKNLHAVLGASWVFRSRNAAAAARAANASGGAADTQSWIGGGPAIGAQESPSVKKLLDGACVCVCASVHARPSGARQLPSGRLWPGSARLTR